MESLDRIASLTDAFLTFSADGTPLSADELIPLGKVIRGQQWDPAKRHQLLTKLDSDLDGLVSCNDFSQFMLGKLGATSDEDFIAAVRRLKRPPKPLTLVEKSQNLVAFTVLPWLGARLADATAGDRKTLIAAALVFVMLYAFIGSAAFVVALLAIAAAAKNMPEPQLTHPPRPKGARGSHKSARHKTKGKKAASKSKGQGGAAAQQRPTKTISAAEPEATSTEDDGVGADEDGMFWEYEDESDEESDEDDYDLSLLLGQRVAPSKYTTARPKKGSTSGRAAQPIRRKAQPKAPPSHKDLPEDREFGHQDWADVSWSSNRPQQGDSLSEQEAFARKGGGRGGGGGGGGGLSYRQFAALDDADEAQAVLTVSKQISLRIQQARLLRKLNQKQLAKMIMERPAVVNQYENGSAVPSNEVLGKLERALGVKLRGKR